MEFECLCNKLHNSHYHTSITLWPRNLYCYKHIIKDEHTQSQSNFISRRAQDEFRKPKRIIRPTSRYMTAFNHVDFFFLVARRELIINKSRASE